MSRSADLQSKASEYIRIASEIKELNTKLLELRKKRKELDSEILKDLQDASVPGFKMNGIVFISDEKVKSTRKKKSEIERDLIEVLDKHEVKVDKKTLIEDLEKARKGEKTSVSALKIRSEFLWLAPLG